MFQKFPKLPLRINHPRVLRLYHPLNWSLEKWPNFSHSTPWITMNPFEWWLSSSPITPLLFHLPKIQTLNFRYTFFILHLKESRSRMAFMKPKSLVTGLFLCIRTCFWNLLVSQKNPKGFQVQEPTSKEFQSFLNEIGYTGEFKAKKFKRSAVLGLWIVLIHLIIRGLSIKHGGIDTSIKD